MRRVLRVREDCKERVRNALKDHGIHSQKAFAEQLQVAQSTISQFFTGNPVDGQFFQIACTTLALDWQWVAEVERPSQLMTGIKVFISYCNTEPDKTVAQALAQALRAAGNEVLMTHGLAKPAKGVSHAEMIKTAIRKADYFLLLLSATSAASETVTSEVRLAHQAHDSSHQPGKPTMLPTLLNLSFDKIPNYDLQYYLQPLPQRKWHSPKDTETLIREFLGLFKQGQLPRSFSPQAIPAPLSNGSSDRPLKDIRSRLEVPRGPVKPSSGFYVDRGSIESDCYHEVQQPAALVRIKAPHQTGKTSLLLRILDHVKAEGCIVNINFKYTPQEHFENSEKFLRWFCNRVSYELKAPTQIDQYWNSTIDCNLNCEEYFERHLLPQVTAPIFLGLDEVDFLFDYPDIYPDFLGLLRSMHENRREIWRQLRQIIVHSTDVDGPIDPNQSPFDNVGFSVELPDFTPDQVRFLADQHQLGWEDSQLNQLMELVGGHPRLVRQAMYHIARGDVSLPQLLQAHDLEVSIFGDHLRAYEISLAQYPDLADAMGKVVSSDAPVPLNPIAKFKLKGMGLIRLQGHGAVPRCKLYRQYFRGLYTTSSH